MSEPSYELQLPPAFFTKHWQREPLLLRNALPHFRPELSPDELAGLACMEEVESSIVIERACATPWEVRHGPFSGNDFADLPASHWTLLVHAVDHWDAQAAALRHAIPAVESWRFDDVMASYAVDGGSVGPHADQYDVFLLQASGRRRWCLGGRVPDAAPRLSNTELDLLRDFEIEHEWMLETGDALYLPPGWAHWGIAEGDCMTYSLGFRAPARAEIQGFAAFQAEQFAASERYRDPGIDPTLPPRRGEIRPQTVALLQQMLTQPVGAADLAQWFGRYMSEPRYPVAAAERDQASVQTALAAATICSPRADVRFYFIEREDGIDLFADGRHFACRSDALPLVLTLSRGARFNCSDYPLQRPLLVALLQCGSIVTGTP